MPSDKQPSAMSAPNERPVDNKKRERVRRFREYLDELDEQTRGPGEPRLRDAVAAQARQRLAEMNPCRSCGASEQSCRDTWLMEGPEACCASCEFQNGHEATSGNAPSSAVRDA